MIKVYPWNVPPGNAREPKPRSDGLQLARYDQSLLDSGKFENRAALARFLGVSRGRVTQVLSRPKSTDNGEVSIVAFHPPRQPILIHNVSFWQKNEVNA